MNHLSPLHRPRETYEFLRFPLEYFDERVGRIAALEVEGVKRLRLSDPRLGETRGNLETTRLSIRECASNTEVLLYEVWVQYLSEGGTSRGASVDANECAKVVLYQRMDVRMVLN